MPGGAPVAARPRLPQLPLVGLGLLLVPAQQAHACTCPRRPSPRHAVKKAVAVFVGKVVDIRIPKADPDTDVLVKFQVHRSWKGVASGTALVTTPPRLHSCSYSFQAGKEYLVYAYAKKSVGFRTNICTRTTTIDRAQADLAVLGPAAFTGRSAGQERK